MRVKDYSIALWVKWDKERLLPLWDSVVGVELYDHINDTGMAPMAFDDFENVNLAGSPRYEPLEVHCPGAVGAPLPHGRCRDKTRAFTLGLTLGAGTRSCKGT